MVKNTLNVGRISEGFVLDHIQAGRSMDIYKYLHLDKLDCCVAIIKNAKSSKMGKKDIMKIECPIDFMDLDILGFIDHNITVNIIQNNRIVEKKELKLPKQIVNVIQCKNPRCITSIEQELDQIFILTDKEKEIYRCKYCEQQQKKKRRRKFAFSFCGSLFIKRLFEMCYPIFYSNSLSSTCLPSLQIRSRL